MKYTKSQKIVTETMKLLKFARFSDVYVRLTPTFLLDTLALQVLVGLIYDFFTFVIDTHYSLQLFTISDYLTLSILFCECDFFSFSIGYEFLWFCVPLFLLALRFITFFPCINSSTSTFPHLPRRTYLLFTPNEHNLSKWFLRP